MVARQVWTRSSSSPQDHTVTRMRTRFLVPFPMPHCEAAARADCPERPCPVRASARLPVSTSRTEHTWNLTATWSRSARLGMEWGCVEALSARRSRRARRAAAATVTFVRVVLCRGCVLCRGPCRCTIPPPLIRPRCPARVCVGHRRRHHACCRRYALVPAVSPLAVGAGVATVTRALVRMPHQDREGQAESCSSTTFRPRRGVCDFMDFGVKQWVAAEGAV